MKKIIYSKLCLYSNKSETDTLMLNVPHFLSWHCLGVVNLEIYRKRLFEFSTFAWRQRRFISNSTIVSREFFICKYNITFDLS